MGKRISLARKVSDVVAKIVTFKFGDGTEQVIGLSDLSSDMRDLLALHGLEQKIGDAYAGALDAVADGRAPDRITYAKAQAAAVIANLKAAIWASRESAGPSRLARAVAEVMGISVEQADERIRLWESDESEEPNLGKAQLKKVRQNPKVREVLARMEQEAAARRAKALAAAAEADDGTELDELFE
jgi:hypothetical protein